ncbi:MAG: DUF2490 domain-containing protein [Bacteroidota bacterium]|nr:DUF2490 domain-containing protein [Bacteroidota bacterium]
MTKKISSLFILIFFSLSAMPQENDFQIWSSLSLRKKIDKKINIFLKQGLRFRENATIRYKSFTDFKIRYKYNKRWGNSLGFRFIQDWNKKMVLEELYRYYGDISFRKEINRFTLSIRNRLQIQGNQFSSYLSVFRQKFELSYNIPKNKMEPSSILEYFYNEKENKINKIRYGFALSYPISKELEIEMLYRIQQDLNYVILNGEKNKSETLFIFEGKLSYSL